MRIDMTYIIANMVVRNEADAYLPQVLARLAKQVDAICVTDDHSDDNTAEIARQHGAMVQVMDKPTFMEDEGKLRQASWWWLESKLDWLEEKFSWDKEKVMVLAIDADEELYVTGPTLQLLSERCPAADVFNVQFYHMWNPTHYRVDKLWFPHPSSRYFRYKPGGQFRDSKLACGSEPTYVQEAVLLRRYYMRTGLVMKHLSYIKDEDKKEKYERYSKIDGGAFHAGSHIESILDPDPVLRKWEFE